MRILARELIVLIIIVKILEFPGSLLFTVIKQLWKVDAGVAPPTRKSTISFFESILIRAYVILGVASFPNFPLKLCFVFIF